MKKKKETASTRDIAVLDRPVVINIGWKPSAWVLSLNTVQGHQYLAQAGKSLRIFQVEILKASDMYSRWGVQYKHPRVLLTAFL